MILTLITVDWCNQIIQTDAANLNPFQAMFHFFTPGKRQETSGFLSFSGDIEMEH